MRMCEVFRNWGLVFVLPGLDMPDAEWTFERVPKLEFRTLSELTLVIWCVVNRAVKPREGTLPTNRPAAELR